MHDEDAILEQMQEKIRATISQARPAPPDPEPSQSQGGIIIHGDVQNAVNGTLHIRSQIQKL